MEHANSSYLQLLQQLSEEKRTNILSQLTDEQIYYLQHDWNILARPAQRLPSGNWFCWLLRSGRGFGKSRCGSETVIQWAMQGYTPIALVGQTKADVRDTMLELGDSSIMKVCPPWFPPVYEPSKRRLTFPNGVVCVSFSGDEPDQLRGQNHAKAWVDELAKFKYPQETWDNLELGLRKGKNPQIICTTTPRPIPIIKKLIADKRTVETRGSTFDNKDNLNPQFLERMAITYGNSRQGRQELYGEILDDNPSALWKRDWIDSNRVSEVPALDRIVVGVDPAVTNEADSDETGIVVIGVKNYGAVDKLLGVPVPHFYVLGDYSLKASPHNWALAVKSAYAKHNASRVIAESNQGGDLVEMNIRNVDPNIPFTKVHASKGKQARAEPVSAVYEQNRVHHIGYYLDLEDQMCEWDPQSSTSPDRVDALVWAITFLMNLGDPKPAYKTSFIGTSFSSEGGMRV
jgi:phage terminase large subunit-like protein